MVEELESVPLLVAADLPTGWQMPDPFPLDPEHDSAGIAAALKYEQWANPAPGHDHKLHSSHNNNDSGRWFLIQHVELSTHPAYAAASRASSAVTVPEPPSAANCATVASVPW